VLTLLVLVALVAASGLVARRAGLLRRMLTPRDQVDAFTRARAVTNTWSADPRTTPAPLQEYLRQQHAAADPDAAAQG
jgi:hypothetical protein